MNNVSLTGRLTREPELRYGGQDNSTAITRFTLAVDDGKDTDFINIKCFGRIAEWVQKWLSKGSRAEVTGKIKTGSYESQRTGGKVYYTEEIERRREAAGRGVEYKAFEMYFMQGMDYAEIAEQLDTGKNTPRRWVTGIINELSVLLWGIDEERVK